MEIQFDVPYSSRPAASNKGVWLSLTEDDVNAHAARMFADGKWRMGADTHVVIKVHGVMAGTDAGRIVTRVLAGLKGLAYRDESSVRRILIEYIPADGPWKLSVRVSKDAGM